MIINRLIERNVAGVQQLDVRPGSVTVFTGFNGSGKSSALKGIRSCLTKGDFGKLFESHDGTSDGETVLIMDDGTEIRRELFAGGDTLTVKHKGFGTLTGAKANKFVAGMLDSMSVQADEFLYAKSKDRTRLILEAFPFELDVPALQQIVGDAHIPVGMHPLEAIDALHKKFYDERTDINRSAKESEATAEGIRKELRDERDIDTMAGEIASLEADRDVLVAEKNEAMETATIAAQSRKDVLTNKKQVRIDAKRLEIQAAIDELKATLAAYEEQLNDETAAEINAIQTEVDGVRSNINGQFDDRIESLRSNIQAMREDRDYYVRDQGLREQAALHTRKADARRKESQILTDRLSALNDYRNSMLSKLPLRGAELRDGEIIIDGKEWDQVPDSRRAALAVDLACARAGESKIVVIDGMEKLDDVQFALFEEYLLKEHSDRQVFIARATAQPFEVRILEAV